MTLRKAPVLFFLSVVAAVVLLAIFLSSRVHSWPPLKAMESTVR